MRALARSIAEILGVELWIAHNIAVSTMERLWHYAARYAPDGDLSPHEPVLADAVGWHAAAKPLIAALVLARFVDRVGSRLLVHDWNDHADDAVHMTLARATRLFADGSMPKLARFDKKGERAKILAAYAELAAVPDGPVQSDLFVGVATAPREIRAHAVRTALASASSSSLRSEEEEKSAPPARSASPPVRLAPPEPEQPEPDGLDDDWTAARAAFAAYGGPVGERLDGRRRALAIAARRARPERRTVLAAAVHGYWCLRGKATDRWDPLEHLLPETIFAEKNLPQYLDAYDRAIARGLAPPFNARAAPASGVSEAERARLRNALGALASELYFHLVAAGVDEAAARRDREIAIRRARDVTTGRCDPRAASELEAEIRAEIAWARSRAPDEASA